MTKFLKKDEINSKWYEIDAKNAVVGRLATIITKILRGKNSTKYTPHMDHGDFVVVKNIEHIKFTGNKLEHKFYYKNTGYPGGLRSTKAGDLMEKDSTEVLRKAVKGMLPKNKWQSIFMKRLKVYKDSSHPHQGQNPKAVEV